MRKFTSGAAVHYRVLVRVLIAALGGIAVWWGTIDYPFLFQQASITHVANRIIAGEPAKADVLARQLRIIGNVEGSAYCNASALQNAAIIRVMATTLSLKDRENADESLDSLRNTIHSSLSCSPADPFLWLALYWVEVNRNSLRPEALRYLQMSYQLGPNEGWIGLMRNRLAFAESDRLSSGLVNSAFNEFVGLVESGFYDETAEIYASLTSQIRERLLPRLKNISERHRRAFAYSLSKKSYALLLRGVDRKEFHP